MVVPVLGFSSVVLRDQAPLNMARLAACLTDGMTGQRWLVAGTAAWEPFWQSREAEHGIRSAARGSSLLWWSSWSKRASPNRPATYCHGK